MKMALVWMMAGGCCFALGKPDPTPGEPLAVTMGQRKPVRVRVARNQTTLFRLPDGQRVMNTFGGDKGEGGVWSVDAGKVPTRYLAVKPKEAGIHTTLHVVSNTGMEISFFLQEVTGIDTQFDAEVDADSGADPKTEAAAVKWVPAEDIQSCKSNAEALKAEAAETAKKAEEKITTAVAQFQANYPRTMVALLPDDPEKAEKLGLGLAWADDKATYFQGKKVLALYEINEDHEPSLIQFKYDKGLYTVPKLLYDCYFAIGKKKENKVTFHRERSKS